MKFAYTRFLRPVGLGTVIETIVHAIPVPSRIKRRMRGCINCQKHVARLDAAVRNVNPFAK